MTNKPSTQTGKNSGFTQGKPPKNRHGTKVIPGTLNSDRDKNTGSRDRQVKDKKLPSKPNSSKDGGKGKGSGGGGNLEKTARRLTNGVIRDEVKDLRSQRREVNRSARHANAATRVAYQRGMEDIQHVADTTGGYIEAQNANSQAGYTAAGLEQQAAAAALQNQLGNVYAAGEGSATAELSRLGITGSGGGTGDFLGQLVADQANSQAVGMQTSSNNAANLGAMGANSNAVGSLIASMNQGSAMQAMGQNLNARNTGLQTIRDEQTSQQQLVREAIRDARGSRKDTFFQLLQQLKQTGWGGR